MNPFLIPGAKYVLVGLAILALVVGLTVWWDRHNAAEQRIGYDRRKGEDEAAAAAQTARNLELQKAAEKKYLVVQEKQVKYFTTTQPEIHDASKPLVACLVPPPVVRMLNHAANCAIDDSAAACDGTGEVPSTSPPPGHSDSE